MKTSPLKLKRIEMIRENYSDLPEFDEGENEHFAYASSKIKMRYLSETLGFSICFENNFIFSYDKSRGRHVVARKNIRKGDVLFVEKAFIVAPGYKENKEFYSFKCYYCVKDIISSIP